LDIETYDSKISFCGKLFFVCLVPQGSTGMLNTRTSLASAAAQPNMVATTSLPGQQSVNPRQVCPKQVYLNWCAVKHWCTANVLKVCRQAPNP